MTDTTIVRDDAPDLARYLPAALLVGGSLNGFVVRIVESWASHGSSAIFFGISPFELIAIAVGAGLLLRAEGACASSFGWAEGLMLALLAVPSSAVAWVGVGLYGGLTAWRTRGETRLAALLFAGLAASAIWSSLVVKWLALEITAPEALVIASIVAGFVDEFALTANVMGVPDGHKIVLLPACSTAYFLPKAWIALFALALLAGRPQPLDLLAAGLVVTVLLTLVNWSRLGIMTLSPEHFELAHGPVGANMVDLLQSVVVVAAGWWLGERQ